MDHSEVAASIADTIAKGSKKLTEDQRLLMAGALAVWLEKAQEEARKYTRVCNVCQGTGKQRVHNWKLGKTEERECYGCRVPDKRGR